MKVKTKKRLTVTAGVLVALILLYFTLGLIPKPINFEGENPMMKKGDLPVLIAHGGGNKEFPDNTLEAFYNAYSVDNNVFMETDVSLTKDGVLILSHDVTLDRKTNVTGYICDWNYSDLISEKVDFGYTNPTDKKQHLIGDRQKFKTETGDGRTPLDVEYPDGVSARDNEVFLATTLEELMTSFPENKINVEIKQNGEMGKKALTEVLRLVKKYDAFDRVVFASHHSDIYKEYKRLQKSKEVPDNFMYSPGISGVASFYLLYLFNCDSFFRDGLCVLQMPTDDFVLNMATERIVKTAHKHNYAVHYWTIDEEEKMKYLVEIGADGIMTNYPHKLKAVLDEYRN